MVRVPYRNPVEALTDTVNGRVHIYWAAHAIVQAQVQAGRLKVIAITNSEPTSLLPGMPTVSAGRLSRFDPRRPHRNFQSRATSACNVCVSVSRADVKAALDDPSIVTLG